MRREVDLEIARVAAPRAGVFSLDDVVAAGGDRWLAQRRVRSGAWRAGPYATFILAGHAQGHAQARHLAVLAAGPGARLTHESAAELRRFDGVRRGLVVVTVPHRRRLLDLDGVTIHRIDDLMRIDRAEVDGYPTTTPARTLFDLAAVVSDVRLQRAIESAVTTRQATFTQLAEVLRRLRRQGKTGVSRFVRVLDRLDGEAPPASELERHLHAVLRRAGVRAVRQFPLPWDVEPVVGCVDAAVVESCLIIEADGRQWHGRLDAMANDRRRDRAALRAGWETMRFVHHDLVHDPAGAAADIRAVHCRRVGAPA